MNLRLIVVALVVIGILLTTDVVERIGNLFGPKPVQVAASETPAEVPAIGKWEALPLGGAPSARFGHTAVWTGSKMIVWGGEVSKGSPTNTGGVYDPATKRWSGTSLTRAPSPRRGHSAVWTGNRMVVWGGEERADSPSATGAMYDPVTDSWTEIDDNEAPKLNAFHAAAWTGSRMIVWGIGTPEAQIQPSRFASTSRNRYTNNNTYRAPAATGPQKPFNRGGSFDPTSGRWTSISGMGAPPVTKFFSSVWTGTHLVLWGGIVENVATNTGFRYDPGLNMWSRTSMQNIPKPRQSHSAVWTGRFMVVFGGRIADDRNPASSLAGGLYNAATDEWSQIPEYAVGTTDPIEHSSIWTGDRVVIWGGIERNMIQNGGRSFDVASRKWQPISTAGAPSPRKKHTGVWTGTSMIVWGGEDMSRPLDSGGVLTLR